MKKDQVLMVLLQNEDFEALRRVVDCISPRTSRPKNPRERYIHRRIAVKVLFALRNSRSFQYENIVY